MGQSDTVEFLLLGPLEVRDGDRVVALPRTKQRSLLALLLLNANEVVTTEAILDALWGEEPPRTAINSLHNLVSQLRHTVGAASVLTRPQGYVLQVEPWRIDLHRFQGLVEEAERVPPETAARKLREALALWRGTALSDLANEPFALAEARRLEELRVGVEEELIAAELASGRDSDVVAELEALVAAHPLRERLRAQLMLALYRAGRQADALEAFQAARRELQDGLGLDPSPSLVELQRAILRQDPGLAPAAAAAHENAGDREHRRIVTLVAAHFDAGDDPEAPPPALDAFRAAVERSGGSVESVAGNEAIAVFGAARVRDDDALRALSAAAEARAPGVRVGVDTGPLVAAGSEVRLLGGVVTSARSLALAAPEGEVAVGRGTAAVTRDAATIEDGRLVTVLTQVPPRRLDGPFRGRERELAALVGTVDSARADTACRLVTVLGEPGIGKTRLAREVTRRVERAATVLVGRCAPYGEGGTYEPVVELLSGALGTVDADTIAAVVAGEPEGATIARRVAEVAGAAEGAAPQGEAHWALRLFLEALARRRPLVVVIEDGHWAHAALLDLVEYVARWSTAAPLVLLVLARPDLVELRPGWATPPAPGTRLVLEPLRDADAHALVAALPGAETLSGETRQRVVALAEGNPLYAEQLLAHAAEGGSLADPPPTVEALIASRLDRLDPAERDVLDRAAVLGRDFSPEAVAALGDATSTLHALERGGLVDGSRFHHALVRDVAYGEITKARRADLHERAAGWLERHEGADEVVGYHLEQAAQYVRDTGGDPGRARRLATDAGERLGDAGLRAWHGDEAAATAGLLTRATTLLPRQGLRRRELLCELGIALRTAGDLAGAKAALAAAVAAAEEARDRRIALRARIELEGARLFGGGSSSPDALLALADAAIPVFEAIEDDRALGRAFLLVGLANGAVRGRCADWMEAADRALDHYLRAGWRPSTCRGSLAAALYHGPAPVPEAVARCEALMAASDDRSGRAQVAGVLAGLHAQAGRGAEARGSPTRRRACTRSSDRPCS